MLELHIPQIDAPYIDSSYLKEARYQIAVAEGTPETITYRSPALRPGRYSFNISELLDIPSFTTVGFISDQTQIPSVSITRAYHDNMPTGRYTNTNTMQVSTVEGVSTHNYVDRINNSVIEIVLTHDSKTGNISYFANYPFELVMYLPIGDS